MKEFRPKVTEARTPKKEFSKILQKPCQKRMQLLNFHKMSEKTLTKRL